MARRAIVIEDSGEELRELATLLKAGAAKMIKDAAKEVEVPLKMKPRRRVLNGVSDNPLLRPLGREVGREKEKKGKGKAASSALVSASNFGAIGVGIVEEEVVVVVQRKMLRTVGGDQKKAEEPRRGAMEAEVLECLESISDSMESMNGSMDRIEEGQGEIKILRGTRGRATGKLVVERPRAFGGGVDKVVEDLEGLQLEEEDDVAKPRPRRGRVVKPVAAIQAETEEEEDDSPVVDTRSRRVRTAKPAAIVRAETPVEEDSLVEDEEDDMSDFIVSDDSSVEEFEEEDDLSPVPAPKSVRKLVRGRRPDTSSQREAPKVKETQALHLDWSDDDTKKESVVPRPVTRRLFPTQKDQDTTGNSEEECPILTYDPPTSKASRKPAKKTIFTTPPPSPKKTLKDKALIERKKKFNENKHAIALSFLHELDSEITDGKVSALAASTGGISIIWSKKLNTTAGRANWKREAIRSRPLSPSLPPTTIYRHHDSIEPAEKVIDERGPPARRRRARVLPPREFHGQRRDE
ncbi:hypothetical protein VE04_06073 [Pseudogymnoascus sp. 24MN13]|nr:hypothetical protein VE04_06073 [Pseudogymnoascus sp. 24MN13]